jgi:HEPN domain
MSTPTDPQAWGERAEEDFLLARAATRRKTPLLYGATFHAQQCAEKYLKALLVLHISVSPEHMIWWPCTIYAPGLVSVSQSIRTSLGA